MVCHGEQHPTSSVCIPATVPAKWTDFLIPSVPPRAVFYLYSASVAHLAGYPAYSYRVGYSVSDRYIPVTAFRRRSRVATQRRFFEPEGILPTFHPLGGSVLSVRRWWAFCLSSSNSVPFLDWPGLTSSTLGLYWLVPITSYSFIINFFDCSF